jgi:hypothetical protein
VDSAITGAAAVPVGSAAAGAGVPEGTAARRVAAQSGVGEAFPEAENPCEGRLHASEARKSRRMGRVFFIL